MNVFYVKNKREVFGTYEDALACYCANAMDNSRLHLAGKSINILEAPSPGSGTTWSTWAMKRREKIMIRLFNKARKEYKGLKKAAEILAKCES